MSYTVPVTFLGAQTKAGGTVLKFEIDASLVKTVSELTASALGTQFLLMLLEIGDEEKDIQNTFNDPNHTKKHLLKQIHAIIGEYSLETEVPDAKIKRLLKLTLQNKGLLKESMAELDEQGLAVAVFVLRNNLRPNQFNYTEYLNDKT